jgi:hypothetical protein
MERDIDHRIKRRQRTHVAKYSVRLSGEDPAKMGGYANEQRGTSYSDG